MIRGVDDERDPLAELARAAGERPLPAEPDEDQVAAAVLAARGRTRRRTERRVMAMAAVALLAAGVGVWFLRPEPPMARPRITVPGAVTVMTLPWPSPVITEPAAPLSVRRWGTRSGPR